MKLILLLLVALVAGSLIYPRYAERADTVCAAFERKAATVAVEQAGPHRQPGLLGFLQGAVAGSQGQFAAAYLGQRYPDLPPFIGCTIGYWRLSFDPDLRPLIEGALKPGR